MSGEEAEELSPADIDIHGVIDITGEGEEAEVQSILGEAGRGKRRRHWARSAKPCCASGPTG